MRCFLVSHTHWDREWYRTFQEFRARLVDAVDRVLARLARDPEDRFVLDGQAVILEDYLELRPENAAVVKEYVSGGRLAVGPWYVQPDTLLPSGESLVRNLEEGRRVAQKFGAPSRVAYTPDSFGHPAQLPQILRGFHLEWFVFWRGMGNELEELPAEFLWRAPDGTSIAAHHLREGYFSAARLPSNVDDAVAFLLPVVERLGRQTRNESVLLLNGIDHAPPQEHAGEVAQALARKLGTEVRLATLDEFTRSLVRPELRYEGPLLGARAANLLPGVWSSRLDLKRWNRRCEILLLHWAEPWAALALALLGLDERPSLRAAWRWLLQNHAHDSICGCSQDRVHEQMAYRFATAEELARETTRRLLERLAGHATWRETPWTSNWELVVFNPSPHWRSDVVRVELDPQPWFDFTDDAQHAFAVHPLLATTVTAAGFTVGGTPARLVSQPEAARTWLTLERPPLAIECFVRDVPPFGCVRLPLLPVPEQFADEEDDGLEIENGRVHVAAESHGTFRLRFASGGEFTGLGAVEDVGDRGDTYDCDPLPGRGVRTESVRVRRLRHASGVQLLEMHRVLRVPKGLEPTRERRSAKTVRLPLTLRLRLLPDLERLDLEVEWENTAEDHRLRLLFPTGRATREFLATTTFDVARWPVTPPDDSRWVHPAPRTVPHQGAVHANGLTVVAPGSPEAEVLADGTIAITLLRSVGWLSLPGLASRPQVAGPIVSTPGAQCRGTHRTSWHLLPALDVRAAVDAEVGLWAVLAGGERGLTPGQGLLEIEPRSVVLSTLRPWDGASLMLRVSNPTDRAQEVTVRFGFDVTAVHRTRLDGTPVAEPFRFSFPTLRFSVGAHALATFVLRLAG